MGKKAQLKRLRKALEDNNVVPASTTFPKLNKKLEIFIVAVLFLAVFATGLFLRIKDLEVNRRSPDEMIYTEQAKAIVENGNEGIKLLIREYNANSITWLYPPPTRIGYIWSLAAFMKLLNNTDIKIGSYLSLFFSVISLLLLMLMGLRFFNRWIALFGLLFLSVSPMDLAIARRTWQDAMFGCVGLLVIYFTCEIARSSRRIIWYILFIITASYALLIKEPGVVIYGLCIIWILWILLVKERSLIKAALFLVSCAIGVSLSIAVLVHAAGGASSVIEVLKHVKEAMPANQYALDYQTGPWYNLLLGLWIISPANTILCAMGIIGALLDNWYPDEESILKDERKKAAIIGIIFFIIAFMAVAIVTPYCQNLRYISVLYVPIYLVSGLGLRHIISFARFLIKGFSFYIIILGIIMAVGITALNDYRTFEKIFLRTGIVDVSIRMLKECSR